MFLLLTLKTPKISWCQEKWGHQKTKWYMQRVPFYGEDYIYQASKIKAMLSTNIAIYVEDTFCCRDYVFQVSHIPGYIKFKSKVLKQINPNLMGFLGVCFYPYAPTRLRVWKTIPSHTYLASRIYNFFVRSLF